MKQFIEKSKVFIIAEAGVNHNGRLDLARKLVDVAKYCECDAVKFQTFKTEELVTTSVKVVGYQKRGREGSKQSQFDLIKKLELSYEDTCKIQQYCKNKKIVFLSTPFDKDSVDFLDKIKMPVFKISSGEITNFPLLEYIAKKNKPMILSTGMAFLKEVKEAIEVIVKTGNKNLVLLHCLTEYPAPYKSVNLRAMKTLKKVFNFPIGYSDHTLGIEVSLAAVALGAKVIEKHITLNQNMPGPDHKASLMADEFEQMVKSIRNIENALGDGIKQPAKCEQKYRNLVRKSIVAKRNVCKGQRITEEDVSIKRPGNGILPKEFKKIIGKKIIRNIKKDTVLSWSHFL